MKKTKNDSKPCLDWSFFAEKFCDMRKITIQMWGRFHEAPTILTNAIEISAYRKMKKTQIRCPLTFYLYQNETVKRSETTEKQELEDTV